MLLLISCRLQEKILGPTDRLLARKHNFNLHSYQAENSQKVYKPPQAKEKTVQLVSRSSLKRILSFLVRPKETSALETKAAKYKAMEKELTCLMILGVSLNAIL